METEELKKALREIFEEERTAFWVPAEPHYNDHRFVQGLRKVIMTIGVVVITVVTPISLYVLANNWPTTASGYEVIIDE